MVWCVACISFGKGYETSFAKRIWFSIYFLIIFIFKDNVYIMEHNYKVKYATLKVSVQKRIWWFDKEDVTLSPVILNVSKMYSDKDFQTFWFRYKTEGEPHGISINSFCINQGVPYKQFYAWFKKHAKDTVIPVEIEGAPTDEETDDVEVPP